MENIHWAEGRVTPRNGEQDDISSEYFKWRQAEIDGVSVRVECAKRKADGVYVFYVSCFRGGRWIMVGDLHSTLDEAKAFAVEAAKEHIALTRNGYSWWSQGTTPDKKVEFSVDVFGPPENQKGALERILHHVQSRLNYLETVSQSA